MTTDAADQAKECKRQSQIALGMGCICTIFLLETVTAHRRLPNPASPYVWAVLSLAAVGCFGAWSRLRAKAKRLARLTD